MKVMLTHSFVLLCGCCLFAGVHSMPRAAKPDAEDSAALFSAMDGLCRIVSLSDYFPEKVVGICARLARQNCLPLQGLLAVVLALVSVFCPKSFVVGIGNMVQPLLFQAVCIGFPSSNKTALHDIAMNTFHRVTNALKLARQRFSQCLKHNYHIPSTDLPVIDKCASVQASISLMAENRNAFALFDEFSFFVSKIAASGDGAVATILESFNGPASMTRETLTNGKIEVSLPRARGRTRRYASSLFAGLRGTSTV